MKYPNAIYYGILLSLLLFNFLIFVTPLLNIGGYPLASNLYIAFGTTCHQLDSRSLCVYGSHNGFFHINSCLPSASTVDFDKNSVVVSEYGTGYKIPVCTRDIAIYLSMLIGTILYPFFYKLDSTRIPNKWILIAAVIPIALDGGIQFMSNLGLLPFSYESTNTIRLMTGGLIGIIMPFYLVSVINTIYKSLLAGPNDSADKKISSLKTATETLKKLPAAKKARKVENAKPKKR